MFSKMNLPTEKSFVVQDYRIYKLLGTELIKNILIGFLGGSVLLGFFYRNLLVLIGGIPCAIMWCNLRKKELARHRKDNLETGFKDWISAVSSNLQAGYSVENAFIKGGQEMALIYPEGSDIRKEVLNMENHLKNNITLERILRDLGKRSGSDDINSFAEVFAAGKRAGGDLRAMIENCCEIITMRNDVEREIKTLIHGKVMEQKIMCVVPFAIIFYISLTSPGYFDPLYNNLPGMIIMTGVLIVYIMAVRISMKITDIRV